MTLLGHRLHALDEAGTVDLVLRRQDAGRGGWILTVNLDILRRLTTDPAFARLCRGADLVVADGMPLVWASRILGTPFPERVAGSSLIRTLTAGAARSGRSVYLLGGAPGTAEAAAEVLARECPGLRVAGTACPEFGFENDPARVEAIGRDLAAARPDIVFAALGCPKQERLIVRLRSLLPRAWWLGVGISLSYVCGHVRRAPTLVRRAGLEWFYRLAQEPGRLAKRYLADDLPFALRLFGAALGGRLRGGRP